MTHILRGKMSQFLPVITTIVMKSVTELLKTRLSVNVCTLWRIPDAFGTVVFR